MGTPCLGSGVEHPHAALRAVHGALVDVREAAMLAGDAGPALGRALAMGEADRGAALQDVAEEPTEQALGAAIGVSARPTAAPADDGANDEVARGLVPVRGDPAD